MLLSIQALLSAPNPDDPLDNGVAEQWKKNEQEAIRIGLSMQRFISQLLAAREWTRLYAVERTA